MFTRGHRIAAAIFPRYSLLLDKINHNAAALTWYRQNAHVQKFRERPEYFRFISETIGTGPITYLEFGVYQGESIKAWASLNTNQESSFTGFDSFEGLPESWNDACQKGAFDVGGRLPTTTDQRIKFVKGWFQETLPHFIESLRINGRLVIHADADLYSSTLYILTLLDRFIVPGTVILFDEFASALHEFRAWNDYKCSYLRDGHSIAMTDDVVARVAFIIDK